MIRVHILGASGSGTSTLGAAVAEALDIAHLDTDSFFWMPTDPPFSTPRPAERRIRLLAQSMDAARDWVLSGSTVPWGEPLAPRYGLIVYLRLEAETRMARLREREKSRYGTRIDEGGDMADTHRAFLAWAARYDTAGPEQRSRVRHEAWLARQQAPVLRLDSARSVEDLLAEVLAAVRAAGLSRAPDAPT